MKRITGLAKLTQRLADTCATNLKSNILTNARCGNILKDNRPHTPFRKHGKRCSCPLERNDLRQCKKCKNVNDSICTVQQNSGLWIDDDALNWFETQQDLRRRKQLIFEEYMSRKDAPVILYTPKGLTFLPKPTELKKEKKPQLVTTKVDKLDPKKYKRISPEFLRLLQHHQDILNKYGTKNNIENEYEHNAKGQDVRRTSAYMRRNKKLNSKTTAPLSKDVSKCSFTRSTNFKSKKRQLARNKAGRDENSSSITRLKTLYTYYPNPESTTSLRATTGYTTLKTQRCRKEYNYETGSDTTLKKCIPKAKTDISESVSSIQENRRNLDRAVSSRALSAKSLCAKSTSLQPINCAKPQLLTKAKPLVDKYPCLQEEMTLSKTSDSTSQWSTPHIVKNPTDMQPTHITQIRGRAKQIEAIKQNAIPLPESFWLTCKGCDSFETEATLKAAKSYKSIPTLNCNLLRSVGDPFKTKTLTHRRLEISKKNANILDHLQNATSQTNTCSTTCLNYNITKSKQTIFMESDSPQHVEYSAPTNFSKGNPFVRSDPARTKKPNHYRYPRI